MARSQKYISNNVLGSGHEPSGQMPEYISNIFLGIGHKTAVAVARAILWPNQERLLKYILGNMAAHTTARKACLAVL